MWELNYKESWVSKNWCFWTVILDKTVKSPLDCKEIQPVNSKGNQSWIFIGRTDAEAEIPILWPPDVKNWLIGQKSLMLGKIEGGRRGWQMMRWLDCITDLLDMSLNKLQELWWTEKTGMLQSMESQRVRHNWATQLNWWPSNPTPGHIPWENHNAKRHIFITVPFTIATMRKQPKCPSTDEWIKKCGTCTQWNITQPQKRNDLNQILFIVILLITFRNLPQILKSLLFYLLFCRWVPKSISQVSWVSSTFFLNFYNWKNA